MGMTADNPPILVDRRENGLAVVAFNRPQQLNAWNEALMITLHKELQGVLSPTASDAARVVIFHGVGRAFGAGGDMSLFAQPRTAHDAAVRRDAVQGVYRLLRETDAVSIAAIQGHCVGSSLVLAGCCDFRICDPDMRLLLPEINMSMLPGIGIANAAHALTDRLVTRLLLTGEPCDAATAEREGFASEITGSGQALERALQLAAGLLAKPEQALRDARHLLSHTRHHPMEQSVASELAANQRLLDGGEPRRLAQAFLAKVAGNGPR